MIRPRLIAAAVVLCFATAHANAAESGRCDTPAYHQFDFWVGDWDTFEADASGKPAVARNHVESILDGCVLREDYRQNDGLHGQSFTIYDASRKLWHQSWVTNRGELLVLEGRLQGARIVLEGDQVAATGKKHRVRATWEPQGDTVHEIATTSADGGKTWTPLFDIVFRKHRP